jgi:hypothetical protein
VRADRGDGAPGDAASREPRDEMQAAPPFLTWGAIYAIVIGALAVEVAICAALTR